MDLTLGIAVVIILLLGFWSGRRRLKVRKRQKSNPKVSKVYPLSRAKNQTKLRRVK